MKTVDDETARLVYIFWTETEKGDTAISPSPVPTSL